MERSQQVRRDDDLTQGERMGEDEPMTRDMTREPVNREPVNREPVNREPVNREPVNREPTNHEHVTRERGGQSVATAERDGTPLQSPPGRAEEPFELFERGDLDGYRRRWEALQAGFVDDPKRSAEQADALVGELVECVGRRRQELHDEQRLGDTEAMRTALRRYRAFFNALVGG